MKLRFLPLFATAIVCLALVFNQSYVMTNTAQAPAGFTGAPGEQHCGTSGCHNSTALIDPLTFKISFVPTEITNYTPGQTYNMAVTLGTNTPKRGFSVTAVDNNGNGAGTFSVNQNTVTVSTAGSRSYVGHLNASSHSAWSFIWTAPATDVGKVTFYASGNGANNDATANGDQIYVTTREVGSPSQPVGIFDGSAEKINSLQVLGYPRDGRLSVAFYLGEAGDMAFYVFNANGQKVANPVQESAMPKGHHTRQFELNSLPSGLYLLTLETRSGIETAKVFIP